MNVALGSRWPNWPVCTVSRIAVRRTRRALGLAGLDVLVAACVPVTQPPPPSIYSYGPKFVAPAISLPPVP